MSLQTDDFLRGDNISLGTNWTEYPVPGISATLGITSNKCVNAQSGSSLAYWSGTSFTGNHFSQVTVPTVSGSTYHGVYVRLQTNISGGGDGYALLSHADGHVYLYTITAGAGAATLADYGAIAVNGEKLYLGVNGSTLTAKFDSGSGFSTLGTAATGGTYTGGAPGVWLIGTGATVDDWSGDDIGGGAARALFRTPALAGVGGGGSFFRDPLQAPMARRGDLYVPERMAA